jgi:predicted hotdog family 3-hydroxylacyl-ACP dehydratase
MSSAQALYDSVPHSGSMCLLDAVIRWSDTSILCETASHREPANPLCLDGRLSAAHAIEYGAQAAALHGVLCDDFENPRLLLAAARDVRLRCEHLEQLPAPLLVTAHLQMRAGGNAIYSFEVRADGEIVASGRVTLVRSPAERR